MKALDLFSGIGCMALGLERAGAEMVALCEIIPFKRRVLARHWPETPILGDVSAVTEFPRADFIAGGFPCQDVSRAGKRAGLSAPRSGLYRELVRAFRVVRPRHGLVENVAALVGDGLDTVLGDLAASGFDTEWDCVPACAIGAPHQRDRVWIVAHAQSENDGRGDRGQKVRQEPEPGSRAGAPAAADPASDGCRPGRTRRPPDSFAWIRDATRWHAGHAYRAGLAQRKGQPSDAQSEQQTAERAAIGDFWQSRWPCEPALLGMDDGAAFRLERTAALGDALVPQIPELIGRAIIAADAAP